MSESRAQAALAFGLESVGLTIQQRLSHEDERPFQVHLEDDGPLGVVALQITSVPPEDSAEACLGTVRYILEELEKLRRFGLTERERHQWVTFMTQVAETIASVLPQTSSVDRCATLEHFILRGSADIPISDADACEEIHQHAMYHVLLLENEGRQGNLNPCDKNGR